MMTLTRKCIGTVHIGGEKRKRLNKSLDEISTEVGNLGSFFLQGQGELVVEDDSL